MDQSTVEREFEVLRFCTVMLPEDSVYESEKLTIKRIFYGEDEIDCLVKIYRNRDLSPMYTVLKEITSKFPWCGLGRVYDVCFLCGDTYVIEERVQGHNLRSEIEHRKAERGTSSGNDLFTEKEVINIGIALCNAVSLLHEYQVIHRDIKPENIVMQTDGAVKLIDFDISRIVKESDQVHDTRFAATLMYAPPEQSSRSGEVTRETSDIYAIGAVLYELLYGPVTEDTMFRRDRRSNVVFPAKKQINTVLRKCLEFKPSDRYENVGYLRKNLLRAADNDNQEYFYFFLMQFMIYISLGMMVVTLIVILLGKIYPFVDRWNIPFVKPEEVVFLRYIAGIVTRRLKPISAFAFLMFDISVTMLLPILTNRNGVPANWKYIKQMLGCHFLELGMYIALLSSGYSIGIIIIIAIIIFAFSCWGYVKNTKTIDEFSLNTLKNYHR